MMGNPMNRTSKRFYGEIRKWSHFIVYNNYFSYWHFIYKLYANLSHSKLWATGSKTQSLKTLVIWNAFNCTIFSPEISMGGLHWCTLHQQITFKILSTCLNMRRTFIHHLTLQLLWLLLSMGTSKQHNVFCVKLLYVYHQMIQNIKPARLQL